MARIGLTVFHIAVVVVARGRISAGATLPEVAALSPNEYFGGSENESYMTWHNAHGPSYTGCLYLEADGGDALSEGVTNRNGVAIHWRVNETEELLYLSLAARAQDGWIGFGMAEAGGMSGADIVVYETSKPDTLTDAYVLRQPQPLIDDCQDWQFVSSFNDGGFLIVEGVRKFNTNDTQDRVVIKDAEQFVVAQKVIAAWGNDTDTMTYHGKNNRARGALRWFGIDDEATSFQRQMMEEATGYFDLSFANYSIKPNDTEYAVFCFDWNAHVVSQGLGTNENVALIAVDVIPDPTTKEFLHHVSFLASPKWHNESNVCQFSDPDLEQIYLYGWTFGSSPFRLPTDVGLTLGPGEIEGFQRFKCEVHYNNPKMIEGMRDNSKLRVYYSTNLRKYELGIALMADFSVKLKRQPIYAGLSKYSFDCSDQCSVLVLDEPVNVIAEVFHMHNVGSAGVNYQIRNGDIVRQSNVDYFDFNQAGIHAVRQRPFQIYPGDSFSTTCIYESDHDTAFGKKSYEEMCHFSILYYPAKRLLGQAQWACGLDVPLSSCNASYTSDQFSLFDSQSLSSLEIDTFYERSFGAQGTNQCLPKPAVTITSSNGDTSSSSSTHWAKRNTMIVLFSTAALIWRICTVLG